MWLKPLFSDMRNYKLLYIRADSPRWSKKNTVGFIISSLDECCAASLLCFPSVLFLIHTLSDCLHGFVFPPPVGYREGVTCLLHWHCSCWLRVSHKIMGEMEENEPSKDMPEPKVELSGKFFLCGNKGSGCHKALSETRECWKVLRIQL